MEEKEYDIFISYRRDDVAGHARLIKEKLDENFEVFIDVDDIEPGEPFPTRLEDKIEKSKIFIAIIGLNSCEEFQKRKDRIDYVAEEIKYAKSCEKTIIPVLIDNAMMPDTICLPMDIAFFNTLNSISIRYSDFNLTIGKLKTFVRKKLNARQEVIKREFNKADNLLNILYPWKKLITQEIGSIKYQYWACGKEADPNYYLVLFPSTKSAPNAIKSFIEKIKSKTITKPKRLLTILRDSNVSPATLKLLDEYNINNNFYTYQNYYWKECIPDIKDYQYGIETDDYYIDQNLYYFEDMSIQKPIGKVSDIVMDYIKSDSDKPILAIIAQAGAGKTTFIEHIIERIDVSPILQCIYISSDEIKKKFSNTKALPSIETVYHLYEYCDDARRLNEQKLLMGITSGSIAIIIDGLEEIIALFNTQNKFNHDRFFDSLIDMNNQLAKCKVIVTSREPIESKNDLLDREEILLYRLQGFDNSLVEKYLYEKRFPQKRFITKDLSEKHIKKTQKYLNDINRKIESKNVIPYILDLICESVEEEFQDENEDLSFDLHDEYLCNNDAIDAIVYSYFFSRELTRQSQSYPEDFTAKDLAYIFIDLTLDIGWIFSEEKMNDVIARKYPNQYIQIVDNLKRAPLLIKVEDGSYKFKYDFLYHYFICLYLIQEFGGEDTGHYPYLTLSKMPNEIVSDFSKYFSGSNSKVFMKSSKKILKELLSKIDINNENTKYQTAISNLINLLIKVNSESLGAEKNMELIKELYGASDRIEHLYLFDKMYPLDFKNMKVWNSKFIGYDNFFKSKFYNTEFFYTFFDGMRDAYNNEQIWDNIKFDITCELGDLKSTVSNKESQLDAKRRMRNILDKMANHNYILNQRDEKIIDCLLAASFIKHENSNYVLTRNGKQFRRNGTMTRRTRNLIECIVKK